MKDENYPALYIAADQASIKAQSNLFRFYRYSSYLLILGAFLALFNSDSWALAILIALVFFSSLFLYILGRNNKLQAKWYQARALAESIKTATWRFMMGADPFANEDAKDCESFGRLLEELLRENKGIGRYLSGSLAARDQVTGTMQQIRSETYQVKRNYYLEHRIDEQRNWYAGKSEYNEKSAQFWFKALCALYGIAIVLVLLQVAKPSIPFVPIEVFVIAASCVIGWAQMNRYEELSSAYGLTAHEIGVIKSKYAYVNNDIDLSNFVSDAENAFSREHTQWAARRDH